MSFISVYFKFLSGVQNIAIPKYKGTLFYLLYFFYVPDKVFQNLLLSNKNLLAFLRTTLKNPNNCSSNIINGNYVQAIRHFKI